jgi:hypothetical protein
MPTNSTARDFHVNKPLSDFSVAHWQSQDIFMSTRFFSHRPVNHQSDEYTFYPNGYWLRSYESTRAEEAKANSISYKTINKNYSCGENALRVFISDKKRKNADSQFNLDREGTMLVTNALLLEREQDFATKFLTSGKWGTDIQAADTPTGDQVEKWTDDAADIPKQVDDAKAQFIIKSGGILPNRALITYDTFVAAKNSPSVLDRIKNGGQVGNISPAMVTIQTLAALFEVDQLMVMKTVANVAVDGVEDADGIPPTDNQFIASGKFLLSHVVDGPGIMSPTAGVTFTWNQYIGQGVANGPAVRKYRESPAIKGDYIEAEMSIDQHMSAPDLGMLFYDLV